MKRLPEAELELMMIIWEAEEPISRIEIEERMDGEKEVAQFLRCCPAWRREDLCTGKSGEKSIIIVRWWTRNLISRRPESISCKKCSEAPSLTLLPHFMRMKS